MTQPPDDFLADVYRHLPFLVVHIALDGVVLHCNPATLELTGYEERTCREKFLGADVSGKTFAQVPKFVSSGQAGGVGASVAGGRAAGGDGMAVFRDVPLTIRTKQGRERVIALSRYVHVNGQGKKGAGDAADTAQRSIICVGIDLTDRLVDAERDQLPPEDLAEGLMSFGPHIGNAGAIEGEFVTPLAISPPAPLIGGGGVQSLGSTRGPVEQTFDCLFRLEGAMEALRSVVAEGELHVITAMAETIREPYPRGFALTVQGDALNVEEGVGGMMHLQARTEEVVALYRKETL